MTKTELAALKKGQKLFSTSLYDGRASISEMTFIGRTAARGIAKLQWGNDNVSKVEDHVLCRSYFTTRRAAAEHLMRRAQEALDIAQAAHETAANILAATSTLE